MSDVALNIVEDLVLLGVVLFLVLVVLTAYSESRGRTWHQVTGTMACVVVCVVALLGILLIGLLRATS